MKNDLTLVSGAMFVVMIGAAMVIGVLDLSTNAQSANNDRLISTQPAAIEASMRDADPTPRDRSAVIVFMRQTGHPNGWPGHVVDHIVPLCAGGPNTPDNMQWQELQASYRKDGFERELCNALRRQHLTVKAE